MPLLITSRRRWVAASGATVAPVRRMPAMIASMASLKVPARRDGREMATWFAAAFFGGPAEKAFQGREVARWTGTERTVPRTRWRRAPCPPGRRWFRGCARARGGRSCPRGRSGSPGCSPGRSPRPAVVHGLAEGHGAAWGNGGRPGPQSGPFPHGRSREPGAGPAVRGGFEKRRHIDAGNPGRARSRVRRSSRLARESRAAARMAGRTSSPSPRTAMSMNGARGSGLKAQPPPAATRGMEASRCGAVERQPARSSMKRTLV